MKTVQETIHWLEQGRGAAWLRRAALLTAALLLSFWYSREQFHGIPTEFVMQQAVLARQLAEGAGFTTLVNYPQTYALEEARGQKFDDQRPYPELYHAPLYALTLAAVFKVLPASIWLHRPVAPNGWWPDYVVLLVNLALFWVTVALAGRLAGKLFDVRAGWLAALATALSVTLWQQTVALTGLPVFLVLVLAVFNLIAGLEERWSADPVFSRAVAVRLAALGVLGGLLFLTEYSGGLIALVTGGYVAVRIGGRSRWPAMAVFLLALLLAVAPWLVRNLQVSGHPLGLAWQNLALKSGDPTAEPAVQRNLATTTAPGLDLNKLGNKGLTGMELNLRERIWSGGGLMLTAFFIAGMAYQFRHGPVNRTRWCFRAAGAAGGAAVFQLGREPAAARVLPGAAHHRLWGGLLLRARGQPAATDGALALGGRRAAAVAGSAAGARLPGAAENPFLLSALLPESLHGAAARHGDPLPRRHGGGHGCARRHGVVWTDARLGQAGAPARFLARDRGAEHRCAAADAGHAGPAVLHRAGGPLR
jgi:hypothetical protein